MLIYQRVIVIPTCQRVALIQETMEPMPFPIQYQLFPYSSTIPFITLLGAGRYSDSLREICDEFFMTWFVHPVSLIIQPINWLVQFPSLPLNLSKPRALCAYLYNIYIHICMIHICTHDAHAYMYMIVYGYRISLHCRHRHRGSASGWGRAGGPIKWRNAPVHPRNCRSKELNH